MSEFTDDAVFHLLSVLDCIPYDAPAIKAVNTPPIVLKRKETSQRDINIVLCYVLGSCTPYVTWVENCTRVEFVEGIGEVVKPYFALGNYYFRLQPALENFEHRT